MTPNQFSHLHFIPIFEPMFIFVFIFFFWNPIKNSWNPPLYHEISHDAQPKPSSMQCFTSFEPMLIFIIDTFLWNPIKETLKPTLISCNIMWHPTEAFIYVTFCIFWAYFQKLKPIFCTPLGGEVDYRDRFRIGFAFYLLTLQNRCLMVSK